MGATHAGSFTQSPMAVNAAMLECPAMIRFRPHYELVSRQGTQPGAWLLLMHGLIGSGGNWATFARKLVAQRRDWGVVLVDLRMHGGSQGAPPPHTIAAAAADMIALGEHLAGQALPVRAVSGHSLGGKVALRVRADAPALLAQTWVLDASPGICAGCAVDRDNPVVRILAALAEMPVAYASRAEFVAGVEARGFPRLVAGWLGKNLVRDGKGYRFGLDLEALRALLEDYYAEDLWPEAERLAASESLHFVVAGRSEVISAADRQRLARLELAAAGQVKVHHLATATHWLHIDARDALVDIFAGELPGHDR